MSSENVIFNKKLLAVVAVILTAAIAVFVVFGQINYELKKFVRRHVC